jgi:hypothetical protein
MKFSAEPFKKSFPFLGLITLAITFFAWQFLPKAESAVQSQERKIFDNYDIRTDKSANAKETLASFIKQSAQTETAIQNAEKQRIRAEEKLRAKIPNGKIELSETLHIPEIIAPDVNLKTIFLTPPSNEKRTDILKNFISRNSKLFGLSSAQISQLKMSADYTTPDGNLSFVHFEQTIKGFPVFQGEVKAGLTKRGEIIRVINNLAPDLSYENLSNDFGSAEIAVENAARVIGLQTNNSDTKTIAAASNELKVTFERGQFADHTTAEKIYFPIDSGAARTAWRVLLWTKSEAFYVIVDAQNGTLLWRKNITESQTQTATYNVYGNLLSMMKTADSPTPATPGCLMPSPCPESPLINRTNFTLIGNEPPYNFNNNGWIPDGENRTIGNAAEAGIDRDGTQGIDPNGWAFGSPNRNFVYTYNPAPGNPAPGEEPLPTTQTYPPSQFQQGSIANAFYAVNRWHDETYRLGFNEQSRNFQTDNFSRGGTANDSILVEVQDSSGTNSTNFATPADGGRGRLQLFIWTSPTPDRDGALDNQLIVHELTHGLSNRLHGNSTGLSTNMSRGMGEGWSDFYALALLSDPTDEINGTYSVGCYATYQIIAGSESNCYYGIRRFPVARLSARGTNGLPHNPLTFRYLNADCNTLIGTTTTNPNSAYPRGPIGATQCDQVHNTGEIWSAALWEVRGQLVDAHGAAEGNRRVLQYINDGMKLSPLNPTILQSRDAIITAAQIGDPKDVVRVWRGFALRGMGLSASIQSISPAMVTEAFDAPNNYARADFDGDGKTDLSVFRPNDGNWYLNRSTAGFSAVNWGTSTDTLVPGDYDGDGKADTAVFRSGNWYILKSGNLTLQSVNWGTSGDIPIAGDYDGDGKADTTVFRPSSGIWYILKSFSGQFTATQFGQSGDLPINGDFDGDGKNDLVVYRGGTWYLQRSTAGFTAVSFGLLSDDPVPADFDGDGRDDIAVFRFTTGVWYRLNSSNGQFAAVAFGQDGDIPIPGDYDGDGKDDQAVYRNGIWYLNRSTAGFSAANFGTPSDKPIPKYYIP